MASGPGAPAPGGEALVYAAALLPSIVLRELSEGGTALAHGAPCGPEVQPPFQATLVELRARGWAAEFDEVTPPEATSAEAVAAFRADVENISRGMQLMYKLRVKKKKKKKKKKKNHLNPYLKIC
jgi:hypothetical protein